MSRKRSVGRRIDDGLEGIRRLFATVASKSVQPIRDLHQENADIASMAEVREILRGYGSANLNRHCDAVEYMKLHDITPDQVRRMKEGC
jgi:hypothetical protein